VIFLVWSLNRRSWMASVTETGRLLEFTSNHGMIGDVQVIGVLLFKRAARTLHRAPRV
jgi:hypothetical protein